MNKSFLRSPKVFLWGLITVFILAFACSCVSLREVPFVDSHTTSQAVKTDSVFEIHFIDVGQADAALVLCDGKAMMIDGGNSDDSDVIYTYLKKHGVTHIDYMIGTHAHEDHIGGLPGALNYSTVGKVYCPVEKYDSKAFDNFKKYVEQRGTVLTKPQIGESFSLGSAYVDIIACNSHDDTNETSIVLKIVYGETSFLFTGDAERLTEQTILENGYDIKSTLLKVGHHGSDSSTSYPFLREVMPQYAVISVGCDNTYGHPTEEVLSRLSDANVIVYRTDLMGDIICTSDGKELTFAFSKNNTDNSDGDGIPIDMNEYVLNTNSMKFHLPECSGTASISENNRLLSESDRDEIIKKGYSPCKICNP